MLRYKKNDKKLIRRIYLLVLITFIIILKNTNSEEINNIDNENINSDLHFEIVRLFINKQLFSENLMVLRKGANEWYLPKSNLIKNNFDISNLNFIEFENIHYLPLSGLENSRFEFDENKQELNLTISANYYRSNNYVDKDSASILPKIEKKGAFINYDLSITDSSTALFSEIGKSFDYGVATTNFAFLDNSEYKKILRLDTAVTIDQTANMSTIRIGDAISRPATILGRPYRYGGIQFGTNFLVQPGFLKTPTAFISSQAALPSTVDIFVNNRLQSRRDVPPGPFSISGIPLISGDGEVQMIITDLAGRQQVISQRFYTNPALLAKNVSDFSFEIGSLRRNYGLESNDYQGFLSSGSYRYGLTNETTAEGGFQLQSGGNVTLLASLTSAFNQIGMISSAVAFSKTQFGSGNKFALGFERYAYEYSVSIRTQISDNSFRQEGVDNLFSDKKTNSVNISYRISDIGSAALGYVNQELISGSINQIYTISFNTAPKKWGSLYLSAYSSKNEGMNNNNGISIFWSLPFDGGLNSTASYSQNLLQKNTEQAVFQIQKSIPSVHGYGYRIQAGMNAPNQASIFMQNEYLYSRIEAAEFQGNNSYRVGLTGALANLENNWFITRRINDSYGLVKLPGMSNVRVYVENQLTAKTNAEGLAFLPRLSAYIPNKISLEASDLPIDADIEALIVKPIPAWRSGVSINFPVRNTNAAVINLVNESGEHIPTGAIAYLNNRTNAYPVGSDGEVYLSDLTEFNALTVIWADKKCSVQIPYKAGSEKAFYLGEFICKK